MRKWIGLLILALISCGGLQAAELTIDLSRLKKGSKTTVPIAPGEVHLRIVNLVPADNVTYDVIVRRLVIPVPPLSRVVQPDGGALDTCSKLVSDFEATVTSLTKEMEVAATVSEFRKKATGCSAAQSAGLNRTIARLTTRDMGTLNLGRGEELEVVVTRMDDAEETGKWTLKFATGARGEWLVSYGFTFVPNRDEEYFSLQDPTDPAMFTVTEQSDNEDLDFLPSLFFHWIPGGRAPKNWNHGLAVGVGYDFDAPSVFAGYGATLGSNITLTAGAVIHKRSVLDGKFREGQQLATNLESSQLQEDTYAPNVYIGIGFRFGSNPWTGKDGGENPAVSTGPGPSTPSNDGSTPQEGAVRPNDGGGGEPSVEASGNDTDGDGVPNDEDRNPETSNPCSDGTMLNCDDNCPDLTNPDQKDDNGNGVGDACETPD